MKKDDLERVIESTEDSNSAIAATYEDMDNLEEGFQELIKTDPKYSLTIDPEGKYNFTEKEIEFIEHMIQYRNVQFVATVLMGITLEEGVEIYKKYSVQCEIKRINLAMYARRFATKMANLEQLGGYLTSGLIDDNIPIAERWAPKDKLTATKLLMNLNMLKKKALNSPEVVEVVEVQRDLEKLNPNDIKKLIEINDDSEDEKEKLIAIINEDGLLSMEELKALRTMTVEELQNLVETIMEGEIDAYEEDE